MYKIKVLLTGATGFIGQHILSLLLLQGYDILCTRRKTSDLSKYPVAATMCKWVFTDTEDWVRQIEDFAPHIIIHSAWDGVDAANRDNWSKQIQNLLFQQQLLDIGAKLGIQKFIGIGSQAEYGTFDGCIGEDYPANPNTAYGTAKLVSMELIRGFCNLNKIDWYWFRLFSCFGEGEADNWLIPSTIKNMLKGGSMDFTAGEQKYAYLYIGEVAAAIAATVKTKASSGVYNISSDKVISIKELLEKIRAYVNPDFTLNFGVLPYRKGQSMLMQGDNSKINNSIYKLNSSCFEQVFKQTMGYYIKHNG